MVGCSWGRGAPIEICGFPPIRQNCKKQVPFDDLRFATVAPYEQGWLSDEVSRPCDRKKSQERGTELLLRTEHGVHCKRNSLEAGRAAQDDRVAVVRPLEAD